MLRVEIMSDWRKREVVVAPSDSPVLDFADLVLALVLPALFDDRKQGEGTLNVVILERAIGLGFQLRLRRCH